MFSNRLTFLDSKHTKRQTGGVVLDATGAVKSLHSFRLSTPS